MRMFKILSSAALAAVAVLGACGGGKGTGLAKGGDVPPPPPNVKPDVPDAKPEVKREVSVDEKKDFESVIDSFAQTDKAGGWNESTCRSMAERFEAVLREHSKMVEAQYMAGLSYQRCNLAGDAEKAYQAAIRIKPNHGQSLSNLGELYYRAGKLDGAKQYWDSAITANGKLVAARINVATFELEQMRKLQPMSAEWKRLEDDARFQLSSALGVDGDSVHAYTVYGLVYMEGFQKNKNRLDLSRLLLDEAKKRNEKFAPLQNAYGLLYMHRNALSEALQHFQAAVDLDPKFVEARMNVGLTTLGFRKYDVAKEQFGKVIDLAPKNYDAYIGLGAALRGLKDFEGAEQRYNEAVKLDSRRGEAYYNLAVLYKDFRATKQEPAASIPTYNKAKDYFRQFLDKGGDEKDKVEAKEQVVLIDKTIASTQKFLQSMANQPPPAPAPADKAPDAGGTPPPKK
jgi:tetratricopeptide (TPR) repeat protein